MQLFIFFLFFHYMFRLHAAIFRWSFPLGERWIEPVPLATKCNWEEFASRRKFSFCSGAMYLEHCYRYVLRIAFSSALPPSGDAARTVDVECTTDMRSVHVREIPLGVKKDSLGIKNEEEANIRKLPCLRPVFRQPTTILIPFSPYLQAFYF
jgi:hypothetical protein